MMIHGHSFPAVLAGALMTVTAAGCSPANEDAAGQAAERPAAAEATPVQEATPSPDTTGAAVWSHLQRVDYAANWDLWPGTGEYYEGQQPHGMLLTTYVNDVAAAGLASDAGRLPAGAIIVKENYKPDSTLVAVTTMYKVEGYNPDANDWFWVKHLPDGSVDGDGAAQGRVQSCIGCHGRQAANDYLFTGELN
ncbi:MAG: cytochrome P460 family protein [Gemmatimonadota bacterium]|nr:cytochrome P460 family protein [Gemmatimonadota bacterium]